MISKNLISNSFKSNRFKLSQNQTNLLKQLRLQSTLNEQDDFSIVTNQTMLDRQSSFSDSSLPLIINRIMKYPEMFNAKITPIREAWVEDFTNNVPQKLAIVKLHPKIFAHFPRPDIVAKNLKWQKDIHWVNYLSVKVRNELSYSTKKPWPQKGQGKARHGSKRSPQWHCGAWVQGPRGNTINYLIK